MTFDNWIAKVAEHLAKKYKKESTDIYSLIDLTDAKLAFLDKVDPEEYDINF